MTDRDLILSIIASLTLCENTGDMADVISKVLSLLGEPYNKIEWEDLNDLAGKLGDLQIRTLHGTKLG